MRNITLCTLVVAAVALTVAPLQYGGGGGTTQAAPGFEAAAIALGGLAPAFWWRARRGL